MKIDTPTKISDVTTGNDITYFQWNALSTTRLYYVNKVWRYRQSEINTCS